MVLAADMNLSCSVEDLNLRGTHILLSRRVASGELLRDADGFPETRICTFELLRMTAGWDSRVSRRRPASSR